MIDTVNGANSSAIIYSIAETAKANNLKPFDYFEYLLTEIPKHVDDKTQIFLQNFCHGQICCPKTLESRKKPAENKQTAKAICYLSRYSYSTVYLYYTRKGAFTKGKQRLKNAGFTRDFRIFPCRISARIHELFILL